MLLISWNVAGWSSTSAAIRESYGSLQAFFSCTGADVVCIQECKGTVVKLTASPVEMGASDPPLSKRKRVTPTVINGVHVGEPKKGPSGSAVSGIEGWESFWALSDKKHRGFNGVVTFVRQGLTWRCDSRPFTDDEFNEEGRAVVTYHSAFTLVNVYVPNARGGARADYKARFLAALAEVLHKLRQETGKPAILAGDLNMSYRAQDAFWGLRRMHVGELAAMQERAAAASAGTCDEVRGHDKDGAAAAWSRDSPHVPPSAVLRIANCVANYLCDEIMTTCDGSPIVSVSATDTQPQSQTISVDVTLPLLPEIERGTSTLGTTTDTPGAENKEDAGAAAIAFEMLRKRLCSEAQPSSASTSSLSRSAPATLAELLAAGFNTVHVADLTTGHVPPPLHRDLFSVVTFCGLPAHGDAATQFMGRLLQVTVRTAAKPRVACDECEENVHGDKMWDTFLLTESTDTRGGSGGSASQLTGGAYCPCPFTCWDQSHNRRLTNEGTRIDYILVDSALVPHVVRRTTTENNVGFRLTGGTSCSSLPSTAAGAITSSSSLSAEDYFAEFSGSERADGIRRAMADGAYPQAPYEGSPLSDGVRGYAFRGLPSTGLFVTPPQLSDHIGVCVRFDESLVLQPRRDAKVKDPHKCMYRPPLGLHAFFGKTKAAAPAPAHSSSGSTSEVLGLKRERQVESSSLSLSSLSFKLKEEKPQRGGQSAFESTLIAVNVETIDVDEDET